MGSEVIVLGGGVIGLTTAIRLAEAGTRVRVWRREAARHSTSAVAGGIWEPYRIEPRHRVDTWSRRAFAVFTELAGKPESTGVRLVEGTQAYARGRQDAEPLPQPAGAVAGAVPRPVPQSGAGPAVTMDLPYWARQVPGVRGAAPGELPPGYDSGFRARLPLVDMPTHLDYLTDRLLAAGAVLEDRAVASLDEAARQSSRIVNCTGLGARDLVPDPAVRPVQGQLAIVANPGITEWFIGSGGGGDAGCYIFPQPYGVVLGGTAREDVWDTEPDPAVADSIIRRCAGIDPRLSGARVLAHRVGLRPVRDEVRLETEELPGGALCVHNYGHGGAGVTVSWGCAEEAAARVTG